MGICQVKKLRAMAKRIEVVHEVLKEVIDDDTDANRVVNAKGFKLQIDHCFVRYLLDTRHISNRATFVSDMLQKPTNHISINSIEELDAWRPQEKRYSSFGMKLKMLPIF